MTQNKAILVLAILGEPEQKGNKAVEQVAFGKQITGSLALFQ